jgi:hypothetical protein
MMKVKESIKILGQAAGELAAFIACHNLSMKRKISATDLDEPEYMDMQTCHELQVIAKEMESLPVWISVEDYLPTVVQVSQWVRESNSVLIEDENGNHAVCYYSDNSDGSDGGWTLPVEKLAKIGHPPDIIIGFDVVKWVPILPTK